MYCPSLPSSRPLYTFQSTRYLTSSSPPPLVAWRRTSLARTRSVPPRFRDTFLTPARARPPITSSRRVVWPFRFPSGLFGRSRGGGQFFSFTKKSDAVSAEEELSGQWPPHRLVVVHKGNERPLLSSLLFLAQTLHFLLEPCGMLQWPQGARRRESHRWQRRVAGLRARRIQH